MGRWAQANRRGGGNERPQLPFASGLYVGDDAGMWKLFWSSGTSPQFWNAEIERWNGSAYVAFDVLTLSGTDRSAVTNMVATDLGRFRMRCRVGTFIGEWTDWAPMSGA